MLKTRFLTRLAAKALVVGAVAGGGLLIGGVANAATPAGALGTVTQIPIGDLPGGADAFDPEQFIGPILEPLGPILDLDPEQFVGPIFESLRSRNETTNPPRLASLQLGGLRPPQNA